MKTYKIPMKYTNCEMIFIDDSEGDHNNIMINFYLGNNPTFGTFSVGGLTSEDLINIAATCTQIVEEKNE